MSIHQELDRLSLRGWDPIHAGRLGLSTLGRSLTRLWGRDVMLYVGGTSFFIMLAIFPAVALLVGAFVDRWLSDKLLVARWWPGVAFAALALVGLGFAAGGYVAAEKFLPGEQYLGLIGLLPIFAGVVALVRGNRTQTRRQERRRSPPHRRHRRRR